MPPTSSSASSLLLPRLSNYEYDLVVELAHNQHIDLSVCPTCRQKRIEVAPGVWIWEPSQYKLDGRYHACACEEQANLQRHYLLAGIPRNYWPLSEAEFFGDPSALMATQDYLEHWVDWRWHGVGVEFYSPTLGTGKTMLATIIAKQAVRLGERVYFTTFRDAIRTYDMPFEARERKVNRLRNTPVLVLDEIGKSVSDAQHAFFAVELEDLIRFRTGGNGVTIITTNLTPEELDEEYPRTYSLLAAKQNRIEVSGIDVRRAGSVDMRQIELIANGETRPIN